MRLQFALDPNRFKRFSVQAGDILLDYSKNRIDEKAMEALFEVARAADVEGRRKAMWAGKHINVTEDRAVMHMALRYMGDKPVKVYDVEATSIGLLQPKPSVLVYTRYDVATLPSGPPISAGPGCHAIVICLAPLLRIVAFCGGSGR